MATVIHVTNWFIPRTITIISSLIFAFGFVSMKITAVKRFDLFEANNMFTAIVARESTAPQEQWRF